MTIVYILIAIVMLGVLIFLHEFGHYIVGRLMNIGIREFAIGMGPKLFSKNGTHKLEVNGETVEETTVYSLRLLPLGGFCAFVGEDEENSDPRAMNNAPAWKRFLTVAAGPFMNLLVAFVICVVLISAGLIPNIFAEPIVTTYITGTIEGYPAARTALKPYDELLSVDGVSMRDEDTDTFKAYVKSLSDKDRICLWVKRGKLSFPVYITPEYSDEGELLLGVSLYSDSFYPEYDCNVFEAMDESLILMKNTAVETYRLLGSIIKKLFTGQERTREEQVSGVVGIVSNVSDGLSAGFDRNFGSGVFIIFYYMMFISLSLGIMNVLPIPALDGARLLLLMFEMVTGKHVNRKAEGYVNLAGLLLLLFIMVLVTYSDVRTLINK